jgi:hypothetical protein
VPLSRNVSPEPTRRTDGRAAVTVDSRWWNPFAPSDYEECQEKAARDAKSKAALDILLNACDTKFPGRRKLGGGYIYYDIRQNRSFDIAGPNPTPREVEYIDKQYSIYQEQERRAAAAAAQAAAQQRALDAEMERKRQQAVAEQEIRRQQAVAEQEKRRQQAAGELDQRRQIAFQNIQMISSSIDCQLITECGLYKVTVELKNRSREMISAVSLGWVFMPPQQSICPTAFPTKYHEAITLRPGDTIILNVDTKSDGPNQRNIHYCVGVTGLDIVP